MFADLKSQSATSRSRMEGDGAFYGRGNKRGYAACRNGENTESDICDQREAGYDGTVNGTENGTVNISLNKNEQAVLGLLGKNPYYTRQELAEATSKSLRTIQRTLDSLREKDLFH